MPGWFTWSCQSWLPKVWCFVMKQRSSTAVPHANYQMTTIKDITSRSWSNNCTTVHELALAKLGLTLFLCAMYRASSDQMQWPTQFMAKSGTYCVLFCISLLFHNQTLTASGSRHQTCPYISQVTCFLTILNCWITREAEQLVLLIVPEMLLQCIESRVNFSQISLVQMVDEVSAAITWVQQNAKRFGGSPGRISVLDHSAGAHLCLMVLLLRARSRQKKSEN